MGSIIIQMAFRRWSHCNILHLVKQAQFFHNRKLARRVKHVATINWSVTSTRPLVIHTCVIHAKYIFDYLAAFRIGNGAVMGLATTTMLACTVCCIGFELWLALTLWGFRGVPNSSVLMIFIMIVQQGIFDSLLAFHPTPAASSSVKWLYLQQMYSTY